MATLSEIELREVRQLLAAHRSDNERMRRLEEKIDKLTESLTKLAAMEERMAQLLNTNTERGGTLNGLTERVAALELRVSRRDLFFSWVDKIMLVAIGALVAFISHAMGGQ